MQALDRDRTVELVVARAPHLGAAADGNALNETVSVKDDLAPTMY
jgi:hypothetical protein